MYAPLTSLGPDVIVATVKMHAAYDGRRAQLLVEGPSDKRFWDGHCVPNASLVVPCGSKNTVINAILRLAGGPIARILGITDDDRDRLFAATLPTDNLFRTDCCDLEAMLLSSPALEKVLDDICTPLIISAFEKENGLTVRQALENRALAFGELRYINRRLGLNVDFKPLSPSRFFDANSWQMDRPALVAAFAKQSGLDGGAVQMQIDSMPASPVWGMIQGHDAICILRIGLAGVLKGDIRDEGGLLAALRLAYSREMLERTELFKDIVAWQAVSSSRVLL